MTNTKMESDSTPLSKSPKPSGSPATSEVYRETLNHLTAMAKTPGWKEHAWHRAKELDADPTGIWNGIAQDLVKRMKEDAKTKE